MDIDFDRLVNIEWLIERAGNNAEEEKRRRRDVDSGAGNLDHPLHPRSRALQEAGAAGLEAAAHWRVRAANVALRRIASDLEPGGEAQLHGLCGLALQIDRSLVLLMF
ncbi:hypothetical protein Cni_G07705 [Canna indica]|uniref:Uncharacterized protein n=1 Tax=Canna indica TaxID=4628 RepID=A0AAQ3Q622_9LILI|nr:hypothetical protein Cni_G07705 [Canna indica]